MGVAGMVRGSPLLDTQAAKPGASLLPMRLPAGVPTHIAQPEVQPGLLPEGAQQSDYGSVQAQG